MASHGSTVSSYLGPYLSPPSISSLWLLCSLKKIEFKFYFNLSMKAVFLHTWFMIQHFYFFSLFGDDRMNKIIQYGDIYQTKFNCDCITLNSPKISQTEWKSCSWHLTSLLAVKPVKIWHTWVVNLVKKFDRLGRHNTPKVNYETHRKWCHSEEWILLKLQIVLYRNILI